MSDDRKFWVVCPGCGQLVAETQDGRYPEHTYDGGSCEPNVRCDKSGEPVRK